MLTFLGCFAVCVVEFEALLRFTLFDRSHGRGFVETSEILCNIKHSSKKVNDILEILIPDRNINTLKM